MSSTPTRRVSLRRKRSTKSTDVTGSPVSKKSSPLREDKGDEALVNCVKSQVYTSRRLIRSQLVSAPYESASLPKSNHVTSEEKHCNVPHLSHQQQEIEQQRQHSPDTPFICSQLCGTQECEVVWDCNSPGYSKDDLKRMPGGDTGEGEAGASAVTFIAPVPHRMLFPKAKGRPPPTTSVKSTTAQLDELLDQLKNRENNPGESKDCASHPPLSDITQKNPQTEGSSSLSPEEGSSTITPSLPSLLKGASSQPFDVWDGNCQNDEQLVETVNPASDLDDSLFGGDDLNMGICDISVVNLVSDINTRQSLRKTLSVTSDEGGEMNLANEVKDCSNASADMFDDDLFNDSVIRTTQAMEEALTKRDSGNLMANVYEGKDVNELRQSDKNFKRHDNMDDSVFKFLTADGVGGVQNNSLQKDSKVSCGRTSERHANIDTRTIHKSTGVNHNVKTVNSAHATGTSSADIQVVTQNFSNCVGELSRTVSSKSNTYSTCNPNVDKNNIYVDESSCSPVLGNPHTSPTNDPPQRRIRNSFRLGSVATSLQKNALRNTHKSDPVVFSEYSSEYVSSVLVNEKCLNVCSDTRKNTKNHVLVEFEKTNPVLKEFRSEKTNSLLKEHSGVKNTYKSTVIYSVPENEVTDLPRAPSIPSQKTGHFNHDPLLTRVPSGKSLSSNSAISSQVGRLTGRAQTARGPLLRSHSTGNAKVTNTDLSSTVRRSNSSLDVDISREFEEDDEFFESLLSVLPEDEEQLLEKPKFQSETHMLECKKNFSPQDEKSCENAIRFHKNNVDDHKSSSSRRVHSSISLTSVPNSQDDVTKISNKPVGQMVNGMPLKTALTQSKYNVGHNKNQKNLSLGTNKLSSLLMETSQDVGQGEEVEDHKPICFSNPAPVHLQTSDSLDDDLFEDDVLTLLDEVETQYGSQQTHSEMSSSQSSYSQHLRCTQDEIARKKEAAQRLRQEKQKQRPLCKQYHSVS